MTSQSQPVTPVRVPKAATVYTPTTQDPDLRTQINTLLLREGHVSKIEQALQHALHAHPSNWSSKVSLHALSLLRSGECTSFPSLMERVLSDIRRDTEEVRTRAASNSNPAGTTGAASSTGSSITSSSNTSTPTSSNLASSSEALRKTIMKANGAAAVGAGGAKGKVVAKAAGKLNGLVNGAGGPGAWGTTGLAVPQVVVEEGLKITRECLEQVCEVDE